MILGAVLRLYALDRLPPGLYHDEALNALDAMRVLDGETPIYFEANNGREPLFIYGLAAAIGLWGRSPGALRLVSAFFGICTIPATYWLACELTDRRVAVLSAALCATTVWTLNLSRVAFRAVALPPIMALSFALLWRGLDRRRLGTVVGGGIAFGLSMYTYLAARFSIVALFFFIIYILLWHKDMLWIKGWSAFGLTAALVVMPLGLYISGNWSETMGRAGQVSILNPAISGGDPIGTLARHTWRTMSSIVYRGDFIPRHNVPLRPIFCPLMGIACIGGIGIACTRARRQPGHAFALIVLFTMMMPTVLAEGAPHMLRGVGMLPIVLLFPAVGLAEGAQYLANRGQGAIGAALVGLAVVISAITGWSAYSEHLRSEASYYNFESGSTEMAVEINRFLQSGWQGEGLSAENGGANSGRTAYIAPRLWRDWPSVRYLCSEQRDLRVLSRNALPENGADDILVMMWPFEGVGSILASLPRDRLIDIRPGARERGDLETESRLLYVSCRAGSLDDVPRNASARWQENIHLLGHRVTVPAQGQQIDIDLYWAPNEPIDTSYTVFCHVVSGDQLVGQSDALPASGYYATSQWRPGDVILDPHRIDLTAPCYIETCEIHVGLYHLETMERLAILDTNGRPMQETSIVLRASSD